MCTYGVLLDVFQRDSDGDDKKTRDAAAVTEWTSVKRITSNLMAYIISDRSLNVPRCSIYCCARFRQSVHVLRFRNAELQINTVLL